VRNEFALVYRFESRA